MRRDRRPQRRSTDRRGFTLVEGLLAGVLLGAVGVTVGAAVSQAMTALHLSRDTQRAAQLLDETMTKIDLIGPRRLVLEGPLEGRFPPPDDGFGWRAGIESLIDGDLYEITLVVSWATPAGPRQATVVTRLNDPIGSRPDHLQWEAF